MAKTVEKNRKYSYATMDPNNQIKTCMYIFPLYTYRYELSKTNLNFKIVLTLFSARTDVMPPKKKKENLTNCQNSIVYLDFKKKNKYRI